MIAIPAEAAAVCDNETPGHYERTTRQQATSTLNDDDVEISESTAFTVSMSAAAAAAGLILVTIALAADQRPQNGHGLAEKAASSYKTLAAVNREA